MTILGIETSCDDTSASVLRDRLILSNVVSSQAVHREFGGVVPELASREHQRNILPVVRQALSDAGITKSDLDGIAVTYGPGLVGSLLIGLNFAKGLSFALGVPFIGINHLEGHVLTSFIDREQRFSFPFVCLIVSGGHTDIVLARAVGQYEYLGGTLDDAAGECFDKVAKTLKLDTGRKTTMGGPVIDRLAGKGKADRFAFPRPCFNDGTLNLSFSGLKTAVLTFVKKHGDDFVAENINDVAAGFQEAVVEVLVQKAIFAIKQTGLEKLALAGGVAANRRLRAAVAAACDEDGITLYLPTTALCTDNAAMIAYAGQKRFEIHETSDFSLAPVPYLKL